MADWNRMGRSRSRSRSRGRSRERDDRSRSRSTSEEGYRLHISDLGLDASKIEIEKKFSKYGPLIECWVARNPPCFAFVVFKHREDADDAISTLDGSTICGSRVRVSFARPRTRGMRRRRGFDPNLRCYQCGERGHFSRDCEEINRYRRRSRSPRRRRNRSYSRSRSRSRSRDKKSRSKSPAKSKSKRSRKDSKRSSSKSPKRSPERRKSSSTKSPKNDSSPRNASPNSSPHRNSSPRQQSVSPRRSRSR